MTNVPEGGRSFDGDERAILPHPVVSRCGAEGYAVRKRGQVHFLRRILRAVPADWTCPLGIDCCLATILGREACLRKGMMTMDELLREDRRIEPDLTGLKS
jgi:hypothetical protein